MQSGDVRTRGFNRRAEDLYFVCAHLGSSFELLKGFLTYQTVITAVG